MTGAEVILRAVLIYSTGTVPYLLAGDRTSAFFGRPDAEGEGLRLVTKDAATNRQLVPSGQSLCPPSGSQQVAHGSSTTTAGTAVIHGHNLSQGRRERS